MYAWRTSHQEIHAYLLSIRYGCMAYGPYYLPTSDDVDITKFIHIYYGVVQH